MKTTTTAQGFTYRTTIAHDGAATYVSNPPARGIPAAPVQFNRSDLAADLAEALGAGFEVVAHPYCRQFFTIKAAPLGATDVLAQVIADGGASGVSDLAERMGRRPLEVGACVARLKRDGLVQLVGGLVRVLD